jgi:phage I-like protein
MKIMIICFLTFLKNLLTSNLTALANTAKESIGLIGLANRFEAGQDAFVQISPLGDFPHAKGLQRMDRAAAEGMVNHFNKFSSKLGRMFVGVPFYVGHPDLPGLENEYPDRKAYGWLKALEVRDDGLYGKVDWSKPGEELLANSHYKFLSPYWDGEPIGVEKGRKVYRPVQLISVGLTNQPNIPVKPLANESESTTDSEAGEPNNQNNNMDRKKVILLLGLANAAATAEQLAAITDEQIETRLATSVAAIANLANAQTELATARTSLSNEQSSRTSLEGQFKTERRARIEMMVDHAITDGRVPIANRAQWIADLENDFEGKKAALANEKSRAGQAGGIKTRIAHRERRNPPPGIWKHGRAPLKNPAAG